MTAADATAVPDKAKNTDAAAQAKRLRTFIGELDINVSFLCAKLLSNF